MFGPDYRPEGIEVQVAELLVATADGADPLIDEVVPDVLKLLRQRLNMDVVFVSQFVDGRRVFRHTSQTPGREVIAVGGSDPLEEAWCQRVVDGRLPEFMPDAQKHLESGAAPTVSIPIGTHLSTPIVLKDGTIYGTLCCFSFGVNPQSSERDLKHLKFTAHLTGLKIEQEREYQEIRQRLAQAPASGSKGRG